MMANETDDLLVSIQNRVAFVTLNRPQALNALSVELVRQFRAYLKEWAEDDSVAMVYVVGAGEKAFCAGGDVRRTSQMGLDYKDGKTQENLAQAFFRDEYSLNRDIFHYPKPFLSFMNGITMGGGFGIAGPGRYQVACEKTRFAMPEAAIGLFPDVGSTYFLSRCDGRIGRYIALSADHLFGPDMYYAGLASHYVPSTDEPSLCKALLDTKEPAKSLPTLLEDFHKAPSGTDMTLPGLQERIDRYFSGESVEAIMMNLQGTEDDWAQATHKKMSGHSPTTLKVAFRQLAQAKDMDFNQVIDMDYGLAQKFMQTDEFFEGVRALLIDKDKNPGWNPATLEGMNDELLNWYFGDDVEHLDVAA